MFCTVLKEWIDEEIAELKEERRGEKLREKVKNFRNARRKLTKEIDEIIVEIIYIEDEIFELYDLLGW